MTSQTDSDEDVCFAEEAQSPEDIRKAAEHNPRLLGLPVDIHIILGGARLTFAELIELSEASIVKLDSAIEDPVELAIGERIFARGALIEDDAGGNRLAVKITEVIDDAA